MRIEENPSDDNKTIEIIEIQDTNILSTINDHNQKHSKQAINSINESIEFAIKQ